MTTPENKQLTRSEIVEIIKQARLNIDYDIETCPECNGKGGYDVTCERCDNKAVIFIPKANTEEEILKFLEKAGVLMLVERKDKIEIGADILNCPCCGTDRTGLNAHGFGHYSVSCHSCGLQTQQRKGMELAAQAWNERIKPVYQCKKETNHAK